MFVRCITLLLALSSALGSLEAHGASPDRPASAAEIDAAYEKLKTLLAREGRHTAHDFFKACTSQSAQDRLACFMFVNGFVRATLYNQQALTKDRKLPYCIPDGTTPNDVAGKFFSALSGPEATLYGETKIAGATEADFTSLMIESLWPCPE